jgi:DNA invertase Pin-like site-specific DNA recombinase
VSTLEKMAPGLAPRALCIRGAAGRHSRRRRALRYAGLTSTRLPGSESRMAGKGRPSSIDAAQVREMKAQGLGATAIAKALGIGRASVYPVLEADSI